MWNISNSGAQNNPDFRVKHLYIELQQSLCKDDTNEPNLHYIT